MGKSAIAGIHDAVPPNSPSPRTDAPATARPPFQNAGGTDVANSPRRRAITR